MAHRRVMGHIGWLVVFVFIYRFGSGLCDISLTMEKTVMGYRRESVVIPCTYTTLNNEVVIKIQWEFENHLVIYRADEQDHIPLFKYRKRAVISKSPSGDVSLTLRRLDLDDRGNFKCKVTGRDSNGKLITQEHVTILKVLRTRPSTEKPKVTIADDEITETRPFTKQPKITIADAEITEGASSEDDSAIARTKQPRKFNSSPFPAYSFTTHVMHNNPPAEAIKSSGISFYILIIGLLCIVSVLIVTIVLIARRRKRKSFNYDLPTMNQLALNLEGRSCEAASNNYEPDFPVAQYESLPMCSHMYEQLVLKNPEANDNQCQSSK